jgi:hypothetical protein
MRPTVQDDDEVAGLPASDGDAASESGTEPFEADVETDEDEGDEDVGLDTESGMDDPVDADFELSGEEGTNLLKDSEAAEDLATGEDEISGGDGDEYGYTEDSEPLNDEGLYDGAILIADEASALEDRGEEGFGDDGIGGEMDLDALPPLDAGEEGELDEIAIRPSERPSSPPRASQPVISGITLGNERIRVEVLQRSGRPLRLLCCAGASGIAWDGTLLVAGPLDPRPDRRYAGSEVVGALAALETSRGLEIALITPEALLVSRDGGRTCRTRSDWPDRLPASSIALLRSPNGGVRLLAAAPMGGVLVSDDGSPFFALGPQGGVVRLSSDNAMSALALVRSSDNEPLFAISSDGAATFESMQAPVDALERVQDAQIAGQALVCCRRAPEPRVIWAQADDAWRQVLPEASSPMRVIDERHGAVVYACVALGERVAIMRRELPVSTHGTDRPGQSELIAELPRDVGAVLQLAGAHEGGITTLHVGTERAWLRITVLPGGSDA